MNIPEEVIQGAAAMMDKQHMIPIPEMGNIDQIRCARQLIEDSKESCVDEFIDTLDQSLLIVRKYRRGIISGHEVVFAIAYPELA